MALLEVTVSEFIATCEECEKPHVTHNGHPSCPGHIRNGTVHGVQVKEIGEPCAHELGWGTVHPGYGLCKLHGGNMPVHVRRAQVEIAYAECDSLGLPVPIDPGDALLQLVHEWNGNVAFYRAIISTLETIQEEDVLEAGEDGILRYTRAPAVLVGRLYHQSGIPTGGAERSIYLRLYEEACDRLATYSTAALRAAVERTRAPFLPVRRPRGRLRAAGLRVRTTRGGCGRAP